MKNKPKMCFVSETLHSYFGSGVESDVGGAERQQYQLIQKLTDDQIPVIIVTSNYNTINHAEGVEFINVIPDVRGVKFAPYKAVRIIQGLRKANAEIYFVRGNDFLAFITGLYTHFSDKNYIYHVANDEDIAPKESGLFKYGFIWSLGNADKVFTQTKYQQTTLQDAFNISSTIIPNGYHIPLDTPRSYQDREHFLWVGSMDPQQKVPMRVLRVAENNPNLKFVVIGPPDRDFPDHFDYIKTKSEKLENVDFLGFVPPQEIHEYYKNAIALICTSDFEGFPNVFLEAWRYGTPVISYNIDVDRSLEREIAGKLGASIAEIDHHVRDLATDVDKRQELGREAFKHFRENYSIDKVYGKFKRELGDLN